jgi:hypothetical protein
MSTFDFKFLKGETLKRVYSELELFQVGFYSIREFINMVRSNTLEYLNDENIDETFWDHIELLGDNRLRVVNDFLAEELTEQYNSFLLGNGHQSLINMFGYLPDGIQQPMGQHAHILNAEYLLESQDPPYTEMIFDAHYIVEDKQYFDETTDFLEGRVRIIFDNMEEMIVILNCDGGYRIKRSPPPNDRRRHRR